MQLKPEEISKVIRSQIKYYDNAIQQNETGTVLMVGDGIARASGLVNCMAGELLEFEDGSFGMAQNLEENSVSIVLFGSDENISEGQTVKRTGKVVSVPVGEAMIGRVVNALGQPIDGAGPIVTDTFRPIELSNVSRGVNKRRKVGRTKAKNTVAAAFIPGVSENISTVSPRKKAQSINSLREVPEANFKMK